MTDQPLVSVLMNCYNGEKYLRSAIESVLAQTYRNWELVFWDNQSTDRSAEIVSSYNDERIKYFYAPKHTWLYEARASAVQASEGPFVAFLDVDDRWLPDKLLQQIPLFSDSEVGFVCGDCWVESEPRRKRWRSHKRRVPTGRVLDALLKDYYVGLLTLVIRREALESLDRGFDSRYHVIGDFDVVIRLAIGWKLACIHAPVAVYRLHEGNETAKHVDRLVDELESWWRENQGSEAIRSAPNARYIGEKVAYLRAMHLALRGEKRGAYSLSGELEWSAAKLKVWLVLLTPAFVLRRSKSQLT